MSAAPRSQVLRKRKPGDADTSRRQQLLRASARLFRERGYDGTSVRSIAQATGMQSGSWVYHFPTKHDILEAVMKEGLVDALARIEAIAALGLPPRQQFDRLVRTHLDTLLGAGQDFIPVVLYEWRSLEPAARRRVSVLLKRYEEVWERALAQLHVAGDWSGSTRIDALLLFGALNWIARWYDPRGTLDIQGLADECIRFFLRTPPAPRRRSKSSRRSQRAAN